MSGSQGDASKQLEALERMSPSGSGMSLALDDFLPRPEAQPALDEARAESVQFENEYLEGPTTDRERFNRHATA